MNKPKRLYLNITNTCNEICPFCFMYSGPKNSLYLTPDKYLDIINNTITNENFQVQLSGGETLLHPDILAFIEYALKNPLITLVIIDTNSIILNTLIGSIFKLSEKYKKTILFKISVNYYLMKVHKNHLDNISKIVEEYINSEYLKFCLSIRHRTPIDLDSDYLTTINANPLLAKLQKTFHTIEFVGRAKDNKLGNTTLSKNISPRSVQCTVFSTDGINFNENFYKRMLHEKEISKEK